MSEYIVYLGQQPFKLSGEKFPRSLDCWLADTTERTSPLVARTRFSNEAVRLSRSRALEEAKQTNGKIQKV